MISSKKIFLLVFIVLVSVCGCAQEQKHSDGAYLKYDDFLLYLGQEITEVKKEFGSGSIQKYDKPDGTYIKETFSDGTTVGYFESAMKVFYIKTTNPLSESAIGIKIGDTKELLLKYAKEITEQGSFFISYIPLTPSQSADPLYASIIYVVKEGKISEMHLNYPAN